MQNDEGKCVELYIPRKCSASNRLIHCRDNGAIQLTLADVDETGRATGSVKHYAISGVLRTMGESDDCINRLAKRDSILAKSF